MLKVIRSGTEWEVAQLQVAPEHQGRGIGTQMLEHVRAEAQNVGADVLLSVLKSNPALRLYLRQGFSVAGESSIAYKMRLVQREN